MRINERTSSTSSLDHLLLKGHAAALCEYLFLVGLKSSAWQYEQGFLVSTVTVKNESAFMPSSCAMGSRQKPPNLFLFLFKHHLRPVNVPVRQLVNLWKHFRHWCLMRGSAGTKHWKHKLDYGSLPLDSRVLFTAWRNHLIVLLSKYGAAFKYTLSRARQN